MNFGFITLTGRKDLGNGHFAYVDATRQEFLDAFRLKRFRSGPLHHPESNFHGGLYSHGVTVLFPRLEVPLPNGVDG